MTRGIVARLTVLIALVASLSITAHAQVWLDFNQVTSTNIVADPILGTADPEEKDLAIGDFDQDGDMDLIVARKLPFTSFGDRQNVLFINVDSVMIDMTSTFAPDMIATVDFPNGDNARDVAVGNINADNWPDIVFANAGNDGSGGQQPRVFINLGEDVSGDWLGFEDQSYRFPMLEAPSGNNPNFCAVSLGDVTGNGADDIYFVDYNNDLEDTLLINDGAGNFTEETFRTPSGFPNSGFGTAGMIADLNGDGLLDIVKNSAGNTRCTYNDPSNPGNFLQNQSLAAAAPYHFTIGDLDGDGLNDIWLVQDPQDQWKRNNSAIGTIPVDWAANAITSSPLTTGFGGNAYIIDLDGDMDNDVVVTDVDTDVGGCGRRLAFLENDGGVISDPYPSGGPWTNAHHQGTYDVALADFNNDGSIDVWVGHCDGSDLYFSTFAFGVPPITAIQCSVAAGDVALSWVNNGAYDSITINRDGTPIAALSGSATSYDDPNPGSGTYSYAITATVGAEDSAPANCIAVVSNVNSVSGLTCAQIDEDVQLSWSNNGGVFSPTYDEIEITRNGLFVATLPGTATSYTELDVPAGNTTYLVTARIGADESPPAVCSLLVIDTNITDLVLRFDATEMGDTDSSRAIYESLLANGQVAILVDLFVLADIGSLGIQLGDFQRVWVELGSFPNFHTLSSAEGLELANYALSGGNVYLSGGETHCFDSPTALHALTGISTACDTGFIGINEVTGIQSPSCDLGEFVSTVPYVGEMSLIDRLEPLTTGEAILEFEIPGGALHNGGVFNAVGDSAVISHSIEIGGVGEAHDQEDMIERYISCFPIPPVPEFVRGDANQDGATNIADAIAQLDHLFAGVAAADCLSALDTNDDGNIDLGDPISTLSYLFSSGADPAAPFPDCGVDGTPDSLTCVTYPCP